MKFLGGEILKIVNETTCGHCEYDEAEGGIFSHCDACCRKVVIKISALLKCEHKSLPLYCHGEILYCKRCGALEEVL